MIDTAFLNLFRQLMKNNFMAPGKPTFGAKPSEAKIKHLLDAGEPYLPTQFRDGYAEPLLGRLDSVFTQLSSSEGTDTFTLETITGPVYQHAEPKVRPALDRFLAVVSDMYRSFLDKTKRGTIPTRTQSPSPAVCTPGVRSSAPATTPRSSPA